MTTVNCLQCPCLNNDADYGYSCNLGYIISTGMFGSTSNNCNLKKVVFLNPNNDYKEEEYTPEEE